MLRSVSCCFSGSLCIMATPFRKPRTTVPRFFSSNATTTVSGGRTDVRTLEDVTGFLASIVPQRLNRVALRLVGGEGVGKDRRCAVATGGKEEGTGQRRYDGDGRMSKENVGDMCSH